MTSSMLAGERRWAFARRGGMKVLGKVAVPKPINLPSQRLEKHGLDANVEIVPKGSHSWGSRPSSSASNPWGSSVPSPNGDCSNGSPSHAGGRPSSGGSGTRPSTAGSDRMHEPVLSAWGSNSRPSSASGTLTSNQTSLTPLRPQSAETRPGSSQLSRFAEHLPDNSASWTSTGNADKLVVASSKNDGFSLSSGDFPTLGSDKDNSGKNSDSQEYGYCDRPRSSSGEVAPTNERTVTSESVGKGGNTNTWKRDDTQHADNGVEPNSNNWQGGYPQHFMNTNVPPQHFDPWRGPPVNSPAGVWYRGPPGGPPYGPPVAPGGFPLEPFPYYRPQMPPPLGNSQPVPQQVPVAGPRGHHPKNGDFYRPQIPDGYMHPGMPIRPGFYPHPVPFDNYYGSPMGYNPNEREVPFMGRSSGPPVFNRYLPQNTADHNNTQARAGGRGPNATTPISEQVESGNSDDSRGPYKVLTKQHNDMDSHGEEGSWENIPHGNISFAEKGGQPRAAFRKNEWGAESIREEMHSRRPSPGEYSSRKVDNRGHPLNSAGIMSRERIDHVDRNWGKKLDIASAESSFPRAPHVLAAPPRDSALLQKIEGLNAKARASGGRQEVASASSWEEQKNIAQFDAISNTSMNDIGTAVLCAERSNSQDIIHLSGGALISKGHMIRQANDGTTNSRRGNNGVEGQSEHHGKGRVYMDADGWHKKPLGAECSTEIPAANVRPVSIAHNQDHHIHAGESGMTRTSLSANNEGECLVQILDSSDTQAQRAKNKELVKQRAMQRQKEEEERTREQKAKALAKLEELNRRSQTGDVSTEKLDKAPPISSNTARQEELETLAEPVKIASENVGRNPVLASSCDIVSSTIECCPLRVPEGTVVSKNLPMGPSEISEQVSTAPLSSPLRLDSVGAASVDVKAVSGISDSSSSSKHMQTSYKKMPNVQVEKQFSETLISFGTIGLTNIHESLAVDGTVISETVPEAIAPSCQSTLSENSNNVREFSAAQKKKSTKSGRNKNKVDSPIPGFDSELQVSKQPSFNKAFLDTEKMKANQSKVDPGSVQAVEDLKQLPDQNPVIGDESRVKVNNYRKSQQPRKMSRNGQANKVVDRSQGNDAAIWAPVQSYHGHEAADEACGKFGPDCVAVTTKRGNLGHNGVKSKRAEMERYVPKPVAKELAQQGTIQQSVSSSVGQNTLNETAGRREESSQLARSVVQNVGRAMESDAGDIKQGKQAKAFGGWKQHGFSESSRAHMGSSSNSNKNIHKYVDHQESFIPDENQVISEHNISHDWDPSDGWNMPEEPTAAVNVSFAMKDVVKGKGKRQPYKGHKNIANKHDVDQKNSDDGQMYKKQTQSAALEISLSDRDVTSKENRGNSERAPSLWLRKPHAYSTNAQTGNRSSAGQHVSAEAGWDTRKGSSPIIRDASVTLDKNSSEVNSELHGQSLSKNKSVQESMDVVHQEERREKKTALAKERLQPQRKHGFGSMDELAPPESEDTHFEQRSSSGFRKHGNQNNRSGRGQEPREDWSPVGQDSRHHNVPENKERQPRNSHYEYQPVGPHNRSKFNSFEGPTDGSHNMGSRYRERSQGQSRRGGHNPYGRKSGTVQVDAGCD